VFSGLPGILSKLLMSSEIQKPPVSKSANNTLASTFAWLLVISLSYVILLAILAGPHFWAHRIKAGDIAAQDLVAREKTKVVDQDKTSELKEIARHNVLPVFTRDTEKSEQILKNIDDGLERVRRLLSDGVLPLPEPPQLTAEEQVFLVEIANEDFEKLTAGLNSAGNACPLNGSLARSVFDKLRQLPTVAEKPRSETKNEHAGGLHQKGRQAKNAQPKDEHARGRLVAGDRTKRGNTKGTSENKTEKSKQTTALLKDQYLAHLSEGRRKYQMLKSPRSNIEHKLLLLTASIKPEEAASFFAGTKASMERLLRNVSLQPYVDRSEWKVEVHEFLPASLETRLRDRCADFISTQLESNVSQDQAKTSQKVKEAVASVPPVTKEIDYGAIIVKKGKRITSEDVKTLDSIGITQVSDLGLAAAIAIALFAAYLLFGTYLHMYEPKLFYSPSTLALMGTLSIVTCLCALTLKNNYPMFVPLSATALIIAVTYGRRLTGILTALILLFLSVSELVTGANMVALAAAAGMAIGASVKRRTDLTVTGVLIGFMQAVGYTLAVVVGGSPEQTVGLGQFLPLEMLGGLVCAMVAIGSLPFLENIFGILTPYRIAELAEPDQPLMRQLEENAPGTYQHSLAVANLAEGGARAIGANVNLVHTGAMYHDIGKMVTPRYFIENQLGDKNPHDFIPPEESRAKVFAHVTNGLALAQKYGLPRAVQAFIPEHQGTTVMAYFYHKACLRDGSDKVDPNSFRYAGPKPQSKEAAIVMLADVSEAVTHSLHDPTMEEVESAINRVCKAFWDDGQFTESGLSPDDFEKVKRGFVRVWRTLHHERLKYPSTTTGQMPVAPSQISLVQVQVQPQVQAQTQPQAQSPEPANPTKSAEVNGDSEAAEDKPSGSPVLSESES
jgi:cyclic-di-AMP phosphodiesterase PgpH